jgi:aminoglycoside 6'-N-acetyltransferase I
MAEYECEPERLAVFVAERRRGTVVGFVEVSLRPSANGCDGRPVGYLEGWFVVPERRRQGIGRALVGAGEAWARAHGARWMASDAYLTNAVSRAAHARLGYAEWEELVHFRQRIGRARAATGRGTSRSRRGSHPS